MQQGAFPNLLQVPSDLPFSDGAMVITQANANRDSVDDIKRYSISRV